MRLWSLHPGYLDAKGLVACWREALLAKAVLSRKTKGYRHHPQLKRFRSHPSPIAAINLYLNALYKEAVSRNYSFDRRKIGRIQSMRKIPVPSGQALYEMEHLKKKLQKRDQKKYRSLCKIKIPSLHPLFKMVEGEIEHWERTVKG